MKLPHLALAATCFLSCSLYADTDLNKEHLSFNRSCKFAKSTDSQLVSDLNNQNTLLASQGSSYSLIGTISSEGGEPELGAISGTTMYIFNTDANNFAIFDITNSQSPKYISIIDTGSGTYPQNGIVNGTTLFISCLDSNQILPYNITNPSSPVLLNIMNTGYETRGLQIKGTTLYASDYDNDYIQSFDISDPSNITPVQTNIPAAGQLPGPLTLNGTALYVSNGLTNDISVFDITTPSNITFSSTITCGGNGPSYMAISGNKLYVANISSNDIATININNPLNPVFLGTVSSQGAISRFPAVLNNKLYVTNTGSDNVAIFDISSGDTPVYLEKVSSGGDSPEGLLANQNVMYVINVNYINPGDLGVIGIISSSSSPLPTNISGPGAITANQLNEMIASGNCSAETVTFFNDVLLQLPEAQQPVAVTNAGSQQKVIQYQIEKLDLLLHKELDHELYADKKGTHGFILGGYDNFAQKSRNSYPGYNVDHYYQLIGATHDWGSMKWLGALGASESYEKLKPELYSASASYYTVWGTAGVASSHKRWIYGLDGLFGYSFIDAKRKVQFTDYKAYTSHGMWNVSFDGKFGYKFEVGEVGFTAYDNVGYIYGHENDYTEHGAPGDNLVISDENISMIRNQLGLKMVGPLDKNLRAFTDGAWVYEYYYGDNNYTQRFVGSTLEATVTQTIPTKNYARINAGFEGTHKDFDWRLAFTGLYGKALADSAISLKLGYKF